MIDLSDITFNIPVKIDTPDRARNIKIIVQYLLKYFKTNILITEEDNISQVPSVLGSLMPNIQYIFNQTTSPWMHRTKLLNDMAKISKTPYISNYDTDVLFKINQYVTTMNILRINQAQMVFPYGGKFCDVYNLVLNNIEQNLSVDHLQINDEIIHSHMIPGIGDGINLIHPESVGGAVFWNKDTFLKIGLENQSCISYGFEDNERIFRAQKLGVLIVRVNGYCFHLHHQQSQNAGNTGHPFYKSNEAEFYKIALMTADQLRAYIKTWSWMP